MRGLAGKLWGCLLGAGLSAGLGADGIYASGMVDTRWLNVPGSARVAGLAGAFTARAAELGGLEANPASLAGLGGWEGLFTHNAWVEGVTLERLVLGIPLGCYGSLAVQADYLNEGTVERYSLGSGGEAVSQGTANLYAWAASLTWAKDFGPLALGGTLRSANQQLVNTGSGYLDADFGGKLSLEGWRAGLAARNLSADMGRSLRPTSWRLGLGYDFGGSRPLALDLNADLQPNDQEGATYRLAAEWAALEKVILRGGWLLGNERQPHGPTLGAGYLTKYLEIDYALYGAGDLGLSHLVTLRLLGWGL